MRYALLCFLLAVSLAQGQSTAAPREVSPFDNDWRFDKGDPL